MDKQRLDLSPDLSLPLIFDTLKKRYADQQISDIDGVKIDFSDKWVHVRGSNTEPILRIYTEATSPEAAAALATEIKDLIIAL